MWECPDFFPMGDKHILVISVHDQNADQALYNLYFVGSYIGHQFKPESCRKLDFGGSDFYAPQTFLDDKGRRIMFGWLTEKRSEEAQRASGWSGVMSLPRVLTLRSDGGLGLAPATELQVLRDKHFGLRETLLSPDTADVLDGIQGDCLEIIEVLNNLPPHFVVIGLVPPNELKEEKELRSITGASFPLRDAAKYKKYIPFYAPSIIGVSPKGYIIFTLPGVPGEKAYLENFLNSIYGRLYPIFVNQNVHN